MLFLMNQRRGGSRLTKVEVAGCIRLGNTTKKEKRINNTLIALGGVVVDNPCTALGGRVGGFRW